MCLRRCWVEPLGIAVVAAVFACLSSAGTAWLSLTKPTGVSNIASFPPLGIAFCRFSVVAGRMTGVRRGNFVCKTGQDVAGKSAGSGRIGSPIRDSVATVVAIWWRIQHLDFATHRELLRAEDA
jgi:hypothetical protein